MADAPFRDPSYLRGVQYKDATNLNTRIALHARFSLNRQGWAPWVFDRMRTAIGDGQRRIAEVGCGAATVWTANRPSLPVGWSLALSDASAGMVAEASGALGGRATYLVCDAVDLPFASARFDAVVANHMLYHVADRCRALAEIRRVLVDGGSLVASTVGEAHMAEIDDRLRTAGVGKSFLGREACAPFTLENGAEQLREHFASVETFSYDDGLRVTEVEPLIGYVTSMTAGVELGAAAWRRMRDDFAAEIAERGFVWVTKASGVFVARL